MFKEIIFVIFILNVLKDIACRSLHTSSLHFSRSGTRYSHTPTHSSIHSKGGSSMALNKHHAPAPSPIPAPAHIPHTPQVHSKGGSSLTHIPPVPTPLIHNTPINNSKVGSSISLVPPVPVPPVPVPSVHTVNPKVEIHTAAPTVHSNIRVLPSIVVNRADHVVVAPPVASITTVPSNKIIITKATHPTQTIYVKKPAPIIKTITVLPTHHRTTSAYIITISTIIAGIIVLLVLLLVLGKAMGTI